MKVLVATRETQGIDRGDYSFTVDGELVVSLMEVCGSPDCGCDRGFAGLASHRATTTALVADLDIEPDAFRDAVRASLADQGWLEGVSEVDADEIVDGEVSTLSFVCSHYEVGTVIRRRGSEVWCRPMAA